MVNRNTKNYHILQTVRCTRLHATCHSLLFEQGIRVPISVL